MKIGIAISTYSNENTKQERIDIVKTCLDSLIGISDEVDILIVNDCSTNINHIDLINSYSDFKVINKIVNGGIAKSKNTAINYFKDYDYVFLMDDDIEILDKEFYRYYILTSLKTKIEHFCYQHKSNNIIDIPGLVIHNQYNLIVNGIDIKASNKTNGCMIMITKNIIENIGYYKALPFKYGHEHTNYTLRCINAGYAPVFVDIIDSEKMIRLIEQSTEFHSGNRPDNNQLSINEFVAFNNVNNEKYITCIE